MASARIETILERLGPISTDDGLEMIRKAYLFSTKAHAGQKRLDGNPYFTHPVETAYILSEMGLDSKTVAVGLLHDVLEDTAIQGQDLEESFGRDVAHLVEGVTKIGRIEFHSDEERQAENFRKLLLAMVDDPRVIMVKLADRLHNMRTLEFHKTQEQRQRIALETMEIYAPIARRLGMGKMWGELEDLSFKHLQPKEYADLTRKIEERRAVGDEWIASIETAIAESLAEHAVQARIEGRIKRYFSIFQKLKRQDISLNEVYDYIAFRLITTSIKDCYAALGVLHNKWRPVPGRIKDFIAIPKANLYQSLHTTVMGPEGHPFEVQIRTEQMHRIAEAGVAAHWRYKEKPGVKTEDIEGFAWLRHFVEYHQESKDPQEFLKWVKLDLYPDEVYTFTPKGEVRPFPRGATPIDFAYDVHTEVGHQCVGAKVNGKLVSLRTPLRNGDRVEILTVQDHRPSRDWLKYVKTAKARQKITQWLNQEQKKRSVDLGRRLLDRELKKIKKAPKDLLSPPSTARALQDLGMGKLEDVYSAIGYGKISPRQFLSKLLKEELEEPVKPVKPKPAGEPERVRAGQTEAVKVQSFQDMLVTRARCCNPVWGEPIVGYITRGRGVSVHTKACPNALKLLMDPERVIEVEWSDVEQATYRVKLSILLSNVPGLLAKLSAQIAALDTNIRHIGSRNIAPDRVIIDFVLEIRDIQHLKQLTLNLSKVPGVLEVRRT